MAVLVITNSASGYADLLSQSGLGYIFSLAERFETVCKTHVFHLVRIIPNDCQNVNNENKLLQRVDNVNKTWYNPYTT